MQIAPDPETPARMFANKSGDVHRTKAFKTLRIHFTPCLAMLCQESSSPLYDQPLGVEEVLPAAAIVPWFFVLSSQQSQRTAQPPPLLDPHCKSPTPQ